MAAKTKADEDPEADVLYRVNGGDATPASEMEWGQVFPWDTVERKTPGSPWCPTVPAPPIFLKSDPRFHPGPDGRYHLKGRYGLRADPPRPHLRWGPR